VRHQNFGACCCSVLANCQKNVLKILDLRGWLGLHVFLFANCRVWWKELKINEALVHVFNFKFIINLCPCSPPYLSWGIKDQNNIFLWQN
jgi:hypothetical protein